MEAPPEEMERSLDGGTSIRDDTLHLDIRTSRRGAVNKTKISESER